MTFQHPITLLIVLALAGPAAAPQSAHAARTGKKDASEKVDPATEHYNKGLDLVTAGDFDAAFEQFERANRERKNDPEILNMLAFTQRKRGHLDEAFTIYAKALQLQADFPQAREYLGEAHIQAALEQVRILRSYGAAGEAELRALLAAFEEAAFRLGLGKESGAGAGQRKW